MVERSYRASLHRLGIGETFCRAVRLDGNRATKEAIAATKESLRNTMNAAVSRIRADLPALVFTAEVGEIRTRSLDLILIVAVTRRA